MPSLIDHHRDDKHDHSHSNSCDPYLFSSLELTAGVLSLGPRISARGSRRRVAAMFEDDDLYADSSVASAKSKARRPVAALFRSVPSSWEERDEWKEEEPTVADGRGEVSL